jgi:hypothetical protein
MARTSHSETGGSVGDVSVSVEVRRAGIFVVDVGIRGFLPFITDSRKTIAAANEGWKGACSYPAGTHGTCWWLLAWAS